jgi:hypothetical protein
MWPANRTGLARGRLNNLTAREHVAIGSQQMATRSRADLSPNKLKAAKDWRYFLQRSAFRHVHE